MKKLILMMCMLVSISIASYSQDTINNAGTDDKEFKMITIGGDHSVGGYGSLSANYSYIDGRDAISVGARGAVVVGHWVAIGIGGSAFINNYEDDSLADVKSNIAGGYGGLLIEPIIMPNYPVHITFPILGGVGGVTKTYYTDSGDIYTQSQTDEYDIFLFVEPGVEIELNFTHYFRLAIGGYYRFTSEINLEGIEAKALDGPSVGLTLKFGKF
jgi:hypothetical protein